MTALYASTIGMMNAAIASDNATPSGSRTAPPKKTDTSCGWTVTMTVMRTDIAADAHSHGF